MINPENKKDRRYKKTHDIIRKTVFSLAEKNGWKKVSVTDVAKKADINRNTFYLHYETIEDVFEEIENNVVQRYREFLKTPPDQMLSNYTFFDTLINSTKEDVIQIKKMGRNEYLFIKFKNNWLEFFEKVYMSDCFHKQNKEIIIEYMSGAMLILYSKYIDNPENFDSEKFFLIGANSLKYLKKSI